MVNFSKSNFFNHLVAGITTIAFTTAVIHPQNSFAAGANLDINAINLGIQIEKIFVKIKKSIDKGETNKIIKYMFDIKSEIEGFTGQTIDICKQIDQVQKEAKARGQKIDEMQLKKIKKDFKKIDKKHKHRSIWMAKCIESDVPYTSLEADWNFECMYLAKKGKNKENEEEINVPITITVGVTLSLCGLFLLFVPIPICKTSGWYLLDTGIGILASNALSKWEEYDKEKHEKK